MTPDYALTRVPVDDAASVAVARTHVSRLGEGLSGELVERARIITSELGHNQLRYGRLGELTLMRVGDGLDVIAADAGTGLADPGTAFSGTGPSGGGGLAIGLAGVRRLAHAVDVESRWLEGLTIRARIREAEAPPLAEHALVGRPHPDETESGDDAVVLDRADGRRLVVMADGLGHGSEARKASSRAIEVARQQVDASPLAILDAMDRRLRGTRGAAVGVVVLGAEQAEICVAGNIRALITRLDGDTHHARSVPRVIGAGRGRTLRVDTPDLTRGDRLILATDGLPERALVRLHSRGSPPLQTASVLLRDHGRTTDDVTILVTTLSVSASAKT